MKTTGRAWVITCATVKGTADLGRVSVRLLWVYPLVWVACVGLLLVAISFEMTFLAAGEAFRQQEVGVLLKVMKVELWVG